MEITYQNTVNRNTEKPDCLETVTEIERDAESEAALITDKNCMKKKMEVASPLHLHAVINDQIGQQDHGYVAPVTNERPINVAAEYTWRKSYATYLKL